MIISYIYKFKFYFLPILVVLANFFHPFIFIFIMFSVWQFWRHPKFIIDVNIVFLFIFTMAYDLATNTGGLVGRTASILFPVSFYIIGKSLTKHITEEYQVIALLFSFILIFNTTPIVSYLFNVFSFGLNFTNLRLLGSDSEFIAFTNFSSYFAFNMSLFPVIFFTSKNIHDKIIKRNSFFLMLLAIIIIGSIGQRTGFFILLISLVINTLKGRFNLFGSISIKGFVIGTLIFIGLSILNFDWIYKTTIYERLFVSDTDRGILSARSDIWEAAINEFIKNPAGNKNFFSLEGGYSFAHNLWLDVGLRAGYIVLSFLTLLTVLYLTNLSALLKKPLFVETKMIIIFLSIAIFATFMVEPIMQGYTHFFCSFAFIFGVLSGVRASSNLGKVRNA